MTDTPRPADPLTEDQLRQVRSMLTAPADLTGLSEPAANTIRLLLGAGRRLLATLDATRAPRSDHDGLRPVLMDPELMEEWATRDHDCNPLTWDWGEPDAEGFYTPTVTHHEVPRSDALREALDELDEVIDRIVLGDANDEAADIARSNVIVAARALATSPDAKKKR